MKKHKRLLSWYLTFIFLFHSGSVMALSLENPLYYDNVITEEEAIVYAIEAWKMNEIYVDGLSILETKATFCVDQEKSQRLWFVILAVENEPPPYASAVVDATTGVVLETRTDNFMVIRLEWEAEKGPFYEWSLSDRALFDELFYDSRISGRNTLPNPEDIQLDEALNIGKKAIENEFGIIVDATAKYEVSLMSGIGESNDNVWVFVFTLTTGQKESRYQVNVSADDGRVYLTVDLDNAIT